MRIIGVIELGLERNGTGWLVGDRCTYADLAFVTWAAVGEGLFVQLGREQDRKTRYPRYYAWLAKLNERKVVSDALQSIADGRKAHGLP